MTNRNGARSTLIRSISKKALSKRAIEIFGDASVAREWLNMPVPALNNQKPIDLLESPEGSRRVLDVLERLKTGHFG